MLTTLEVVVVRDNPSVAASLNPLQLAMVGMLSSAKGSAWMFQPAIATPALRRLEVFVKCCDRDPLPSVPSLQGAPHLLTTGVVLDLHSTDIGFHLVRLLPHGLDPLAESRLVVAQGSELFVDRTREVVVSAFIAAIAHFGGGFVGLISESDPTAVAERSPRGQFDIALDPVTSRRVV